MASSTPTQVLATLLLGQDVMDWIRERKAHPYQPSLDAIAAELRDATDGRVDVTRETLRLWLKADEPAEATA